MEDARDMLYFTTTDLKIGKKIPFYLPPSTPPLSLPKEITDSIPFSLKQLPQILDFFSIPSGSPQAHAVELTLRECEREPLVGETKFCSTSMESMAELACSALGSSVKFLATTLLKKSKSPSPTNNLQNYTLLQMPNEIKVSNYFACHIMAYPYAVHYCHSRLSHTKVFQCAMEGENGDQIQILATCHMDTLGFNPNHRAFRVLKAKPGTIPLCHIFPFTHRIWIPLSTFASA
ncbi:BURP domain-containing protein BNM2A-like isoform X2 [Momordica charantia]|nr:BURP domain-containing protein BNM2A-like isoform X2 [Momordica charantia]